jgi:hypothetical protein
MVYGFRQAQDNFKCKLPFSLGTSFPFLSSINITQAQARTFSTTKEKVDVQHQYCGLKVIRNLSRL